MNHVYHMFTFVLSRKFLCIYSILLMAMTSCDSENANDCFQVDGALITKEISVAFFTKIQMEDDIRVILKEGPIQSVLIETGENLVPDLNVEVLEETLILQNNNGCNFLREYGRTLVTVTSPNITFIRQASAFELRSEGVLTYPELLIWSNTNPNSLNIEDANKSGSVILNLNCQTLRIAANGSSNFIISGQAETASINFSDEFPQLDARDFLVNDLTIAHTGAADMIVHPIDRIGGIIKATGDVISVNEPPIVEVEELFTGRLIFQ